MEKTGPQTYTVKGCHLSPPAMETGRTGASPVQKWKSRWRGYGSMKNAVFRIRDLPAFFLPYAIFPAKTKRQSGVLLLPSGIRLETACRWRSHLLGHFRSHGCDFLRAIPLRARLDTRVRIPLYVAEDGLKGDFLFDILQDKIEEKDLTEP